MTNFESVVRMWRKMFETYAIGPIPPDDDIREAVLADRPRFEAKLAASTADLPENRFAAITYESLIANPVGVIEQLYEQLELGDFEPVREAIVAETKRRSGYQAKGSLPSDLWRQRINNEWAAILTQHATLVSCDTEITETNSMPYSYSSIRRKHAHWTPQGPTDLQTPEERRELESLAHRSRSVPALARRARIVLGCAAHRTTRRWLGACAPHRRRWASGARGLCGNGSRGCTMSPARSSAQHRR